MSPRIPIPARTQIHVINERFRRLEATPEAVIVFVAIVIP
jgi:hypothetical protein